MTKTTDYEHLLQLENVIGVEWDEKRERVIVFVTEKVPEDELPDEAIVSHSLDDDQDSDVIKGGMVDLHIGDEFEIHDADPAALTAETVDATSANPRKRHRPVTAGLSEGPAERRMAGTGGILARVEDPDTSYWASDVEQGQMVRLSNCHVYADSRSQGELFGDEIVQPASLDGGDDGDVVGKLVGYVPMLDNLHVDVAARSIRPPNDTNGTNALPNEWPSGVRRTYDDLPDKIAYKSGRTTTVTRAPVLATSATIRVRISDTRTKTYRDQIVTGPLSDPGDSGAPVFDAEGRVMGPLFAGSDQITIINKATAIEDEFGVRIHTDPYPDTEPEPTPGTDPETDPDPGPGPGIEAPPDEVTYTVTVSADAPYGTLEYSFLLDDNAEIEFAGNSSTLVDRRVNAWLAMWSNTYTIRDGAIASVSFPDEATVFLEGEEIDPQTLPERTSELAGDREST